MAQIDASIPLGVRPVQMENPMNQLARVMQVQGFQDEREARRQGLEKQNRLSQLLGQTYSKPEEREEALLRGGFVDQATKLSTDRRANAKSDNETEAGKFKLATERHDYFKKTLGALSQEANLTKDMVLQAGQALVQQGILPAEMYQQSLANMPDDPAQLRAKLVQGLKSQMTPEQIFTIFAPKPTQVDNGAQIGFRDTNPNSPTFGQNTAGGAVQKVVSPDAVLRTNAALENARATRDAARETAGATRDAARMQTGFQNEQGLRKEFEALPEVKKYKQALPSYKGIEDAVSRNTAQSDINIVYGIAKLYDPDSVVREGEYATVANSPNIPDRIKGYAQYLAGGGKLTPKVKGEILAEARSRMQSFENEFSAARTNFESIANRSNVDTSRVFPAPHSPAVAVDLGSLPAGGAPAGKPKVVDFGSLK